MNTLLLADSLASWRRPSPGGLAPLNWIKRRFAARRVRITEREAMAELHTLDRRGLEDAGIDVLVVDESLPRLVSSNPYVIGMLAFTPARKR